MTFLRLVLYFNPTFEELNEEAVAVKGGILDAKKHSVVVFQKKVNPNLAGASDNSGLADAESSSRSTKRKGIGEKSLGSKGVWKINMNKTVKGSGSMLKASNLISSELNGQEAKILTNEEGKRQNIFPTGRHCGVKADAIIAKLGLEKSHRVEAVGFSRVRRKPLILMCLGIIPDLSLFVSILYIDLPDRQKRKLLWRDLLLFIPSGFYPWMAIRDFNAILLSSDKKGGQLQDLGFRGLPYSWHRGNLFERLDQALRNDVWLEFFPSSLVSRIPRIKSNHRPLFFNLYLDINTSFGRPFRFLASWAEHPDFLKFVAGNWNFDGDMTSTIARFTNRLKNWT
ncbi:Retrovirus-related Pol polyprotein LINE-1 [Gossypium australe]|uniref:Retrovirus-related Pol polyprotein LINE-1 n=1 Tax=Gossypium australe TaxID=47621 RepID=A0A5B6WVK9_9ROSI|nr:Retrovirus-related Pol polyprotein LINE-1 [Gossypium australe]